MIFDLLNNILGKPYNNSEESRSFICGNPSCESQKKDGKKRYKLSITKINRESDGSESFIFHCWVCGKSGIGFYQLRKEFPNINVPNHVFKKAGKKKFFGTTGSIPKSINAAIYFRNNSFVRESTRFEDIKDWIIKEKISNYLIKKRGLSIDDILYFDVRWHEKYSNYILFPSKDFEQDYAFFNFYVLRNFNEKSKSMRYINCEGKLKNTLPFISYTNFHLNYFILVEGIFDFMKLLRNGFNPIPLMGSYSLSSSLIRVLYENNLSMDSNIFIGLDFDNTDGIEKKSNKIFDCLKDHGFNNTSQIPSKHIFGKNNNYNDFGRVPNNDLGVWKRLREYLLKEGSKKT